MSTQVHSENTSATTEMSQPAASGAEGGASNSQEAGAAQGASGSESTEGTSDPADAAAEGDETAPPAYKPREKFKVMDKEHEVPAWLKSMMKDADTEKQAIELLEKAYGLDSVKEERVSARKERDQFKTELTGIQTAIGEVRAAYQRGDIDMFLDKLQIPQERMLQWALDKVNYSQLPPEQQRVLDERREAQRKAYDAEKRVGTYEQQIHEQARQAKTMLLEAGLARPDVSTFAQAYDSRVGKPGAFKAEVAATGELAWIQSQGKVDLSPEQAIEQVMQKWRPFLGAAPSVPGTQPGPTQVASETGTQPNATAKPSVIPNVQGKSQSPLKSKPRSIADLKKLRDQAAG
jgi:hypothetical protein